MGVGQPCSSATMLQSRDIVRAFKLGGLGIGKEALSVLSGHLATCSDAEAEITRVMQCVKASGERMFFRSVPPSCTPWGNCSNEFSGLREIKSAAPHRTAPNRGGNSQFEQAFPASRRKNKDRASQAV